MPYRTDLSWATAHGTYGGDGLELKESSMPGAGRGVHARLPIPTETIVTEVCGRRISSRSYETMKAAGDPRVLYSASDESDTVHLVLYGPPFEPTVGQGIGMFINCAGKAASATATNCRFVTVNCGGSNGGVRIFAETTRAIQQGEELKVLYGHEWWAIYDRVQQAAAAKKG
jgi:hypothetical protein